MAKTYDDIKAEVVFGEHRNELWEIKDSGKRQEFDTGARRDIQENKGRPDLLPFRALERLSLHFEMGCKKYGERNWEKGIPVSRYLASALRHFFKFMIGRKDEPHLVALIWNLMCALETMQRVKEGILPQSLYDFGSKDDPL